VESLPPDPAVRVSPVRIRPYRPDDAPRLYEAARESVGDVFPWLAWCHPQYTLAEAAAWAESREELARQALEYHFVITGDGDRFLGGCGINHINRIHRFGNLGYWVRSSATGRGVAVSAVALSAAFAFQNTDLVRLEIVCAVGNRRSQRVAEKAGAVREGVLRDRLRVNGAPHDAVMYSVVRPR
jgi:ribosomal-protein-serine acetyltransferase